MVFLVSPPVPNRTNQRVTSVVVLRLNADAQQLFQDLRRSSLPVRQAHDLGGNENGALGTKNYHGMWLMGLLYIYNSL